VGYYKVQGTTRLLFDKNSTVTNGTEVDWDDIHQFLHFIDHLEVLVGRLNDGRPRGICVPLVHTLHRSNCVKKLMVRAVFCYISCS
jgi:hypothetical protein